MVPLRELVRPAGRRAGSNTDLPVYSVTKHAGFVPSLEYFKKQVFSRDVEGYKLVEPGEFAYATIHLDEGSVGIAPERALISPMYTVFAADSAHINANYLIRYLKSPRALAHYPQLGKGAIHRRKAISLESLGALPVPLPSLDEQRRIAAILDHTDTLRTKRRQTLTHLDTLPQAIFHQMFDGDPATTTVADIATSERASIRTGPFGSQLKHGEFVDAGVAVLGLDNVVGNQFSWGQRRFISTEKYEQLRRYTVFPGDVLISIMGTTGRCVIVPDGIPTAINTKHICAITPDPRVMDPHVLRACFLWHPEARAHLRRQTKGSIMDGLNMEIIKSMPLPVPSTSAQQTFRARMSNLAREAEHLRKSDSQSGYLFASLQTRAFKGEL